MEKTSKSNGPNESRADDKGGCPRTSNPTENRITDLQTDAIRPNFPPGVSRPALRALLAANLTTLESLTTISERELASLHGMGPKAIRLLKAALDERHPHFRPEKAVETHERE